MRRVFLLLLASCSVDRSTTTTGVDPTEVPTATALQCQAGQVIAWDGTGWACATPSAGVDYSVFGQCAGTDKARGIDGTTGAVLCAADVDTPPDPVVYGVPPGTVSAFAGSEPPPGWLVCDGQTYQRSAYPALFAAIGVNWGAPDGNSFNVPDLRGRFLRGVSGPGGLDPDCATRTASGPGGIAGCSEPGTLQDDDVASHTHDLAIGVHVSYNDCNACGNYTDMARPGFSSTTTAFGGSETRPLNAAVEFIVKY